MSQFSVTAALSF